MVSNGQLHFNYIIVILVSIIVGLVSVQWSEVPKLVDYLTFALTLSSLILAGLAIVYSIYSNTSISGSLSEISAAAKEVSSSSMSINQSNIELREEVEKIPVMLDVVDRNIVDTKNIVSTFSEKQEAFTKVDMQANPVGAIDKGISDDHLSEFLSLTSIRGLEVLLMVTLSLESETSFNFEEFVENNENYGGTSEYLYGFFMSMVSLGLVIYLTDAKDRFTIKSVNKFIKANIRKRIKERVISGAKEYAKDYDDQEEEEVVERWLASYYLIGKYFRIELS